MAELKLHEGRISMAQGLGQKLDAMKSELQTESYRLEGAIGILNQARERLAGHKSYWKTDFDEEKVDKNAFKTAMTAIDECIGICGNLMEDARIQHMSQLGKMENCNTVASLVESMARDEAAFIKSIIDAPPDALVGDASRRPGPRLVHERADAEAAATQAATEGEPLIFEGDGNLATPEEVVVDAEDPVVAEIPQEEQWLHDNPEAKASVVRGLEQMGRGETVAATDEKKPKRKRKAE